MLARYKSTFILVLLLGLLYGSYYYWFRTPKESIAPSATPEIVQLFNYTETDIAEVSWKYASGSGTLQRSDAGWKLVSPPVSVDQAKVGAFISSFTRLDGQYRYSLDKVSKETAGVNNPSYTLTVKKKDGNVQTLLIGRQAIGGDYYYAFKEDTDFVTLLSSYVISGMEIDPYSLSPSPSGSPAAMTP